MAALGERKKTALTADKKSLVEHAPDMAKADVSLNPVTQPIMTVYEMAKIWGDYTDIVAYSQGSTALGYKLNDESPAMEAGRLILEGKVPFIVKRDILPDITDSTKKVYDVFDASKMKFDTTLLVQLMNLHSSVGFSRHGITRKEIDELMTTVDRKGSLYGLASDLKNEMDVGDDGVSDASDDGEGRVMEAE
jgi:hypothetical protein